MQLDGPQLTGTVFTPRQKADFVSVVGHLVLYEFNTPDAREMAPCGCQLGLVPLTDTVKARLSWFHATTRVGLRTVTVTDIPDSYRAVIGAARQQAGVSRPQLEDVGDGHTKNGAPMAIEDVSE